jgi:hypothetical protein
MLHPSSRGVLDCLHEEHTLLSIYLMINNIDWRLRGLINDVSPNLLTSARAFSLTTKRGRVINTGGRRFKSSLPDHYFRILKLHFWVSVYIDGVDFVDGACADDFLPVLRERLQCCIYVRTCKKLLDCSSDV